MASLTERSPSAQDTQRGNCEATTPNSDAFSSANGSSGPTNAKAAAKAIEKKIAVSSTDPASEANTGARHQDLRRSRLNTVTSSNWPIRKAEPEAAAMRTSLPAAV